MRNELTYRSIQALHQEKGYSIFSLCAMGNVNRSAYYNWLRRKESFREQENRGILLEISALQKKYNGILGVRRMTMYLNKKRKKRLNRKRIHRIMRLFGLLSVIRRKRPKYQRTRPEMTAGNILNREFTAGSINEKWLTDVTEFKYGAGQKAYLSAILDLKDRRIVAYVLGHSNNNPLVFQTLDAAIERNPSAKPLLHSDRGFQYTSRVFWSKLNAAGITQSMSRVGRCIDNGPMEGFWGILKTEMYYRQKFQSFGQLKEAIDTYIQFYNTERLQERLGCRSPMEYHLLHS